MFAIMLLKSRQKQRKVVKKPPKMCRNKNNPAFDKKKYCAKPMFHVKHFCRKGLPDINEVRVLFAVFCYVDEPFLFFGGVLAVFWRCFGGVLAVFCED